jgi:hypothetical protein
MKPKSCSNYPFKTRSVAFLSSGSLECSSNFPGGLARSFSCFSDAFRGGLARVFNAVSGSLSRFLRSFGLLPGFATLQAPFLDASTTLLLHRRDDYKE